MLVGGGRRREEEREGEEGGEEGEEGEGGWGWWRQCIRTRKGRISDLHSTNPMERGEGGELREFTRVHEGDDKATC